MITRTKTILIAALSMFGLGLLPDQAEAGRDRCSVNNSGRGGYGNSSYRQSSYGVRYQRQRQNYTYRTRCRAIHSCYFVRNCHRYKKTTYLHEKVRSCGRVVSRWKTYKTVCVGRVRH